MRDQNLQAMLTKAKTAHQAGDLARAAEICDAILAILPDQLDALRRAVDALDLARERLQSVWRTQRARAKTGELLLRAM